MAEKQYISADRSNMADWPLDSIIDYSNAGGANNIKTQISAIDQKLEAYLKAVDACIDTERDYGLSGKYFKIDGVKVTQKSVTAIHDAVVELRKQWKTIKKNIKKAALEARIKTLNEMDSACSAKLSLSAGWIPDEDLTGDDKKYTDKRTKIRAMIENTQKRLNKM